MIKKLQDINVIPQAIEQPLDISIPENKMILAIYLATPEVENDIRSLNVKEKMQKARAMGSGCEMLLSVIETRNRRLEKNI